MLFGGEDHGLLAAFPPGAALPDGFVVIGSVHARGEQGSGHDGDLTLGGAQLTPRGWDPFTVRPPGS
jgi:thiamine-monophosphate kinase